MYGSSRMEKLLEGSRIRRKEVSYKIHSAKSERVGFQSRYTDARTGFKPTGTKVFVSPSKLEEDAIEAEIQSSKFILKITNEEGSEDFVPYAKSTWDRATSFLRRLMIAAHSADVIGIGVPRIGPADQGSIDLFWESGEKTLLINFPATVAIATYYAKKPGSELSARIDPAKAHPELAMWLAAD